MTVGVKAYVRGEAFNAGVVAAYYKSGMVELLIDLNQLLYVVFSIFIKLSRLIYHPR